MSGEPLSRMQLDVLELERRTWPQEGAKISEFRRRNPTVTEVGYYAALLTLLRTPAAYEYGNRRYAAMLRGIDERYHQEMARRVGLRDVPPRL